MSRPTFHLVYFADPTIHDFTHSEVVGLGRLLNYKLGLHYLSATLERADYPCRIRDQTVDRFTQDDLERDIARETPLAVGFYTATDVREVVTSTLKRLRARFPALPLFCGGPGAIDDALYLRAGSDAVVRGEGEITLPELLRAVEQRRPLGGIAGISFLDSGGGVVRTPDRPLIEDLDSLPPPVLTEEMVLRYRSYSIRPRRRQLQVLTSRGCPFHCAFCASPAMWGGRLRTRSVKNVMAEIDDARRRLDISHVYFVDDVFGWDREWLGEFVEEMDRRPGLTWNCNLHPLSLHDDPEKWIQRLAAVGLVSLDVGIQTIDRRSRRAMHRAPAEPAAAARLISAARAAGMSTEVHFIFGMPWDSAATFDEVLEFLIRARPNVIQLFPLLRLPGAEFDSSPPDPPRLSSVEIERLIARTARRYYFHPAVMLQNVRYILRYNPAFLVTELPRLALNMVRAGGEKAVAQ